MKIVHQGVLHLGCSKHRGQLWFPNTFCEPRAGWSLAKMFIKVGSQSLDLFTLIFGRNHRENGLVETAAN